MFRVSCVQLVRAKMQGNHKFWIDLAKNKQKKYPMWTHDFNVWKTTYRILIVTSLRKTWETDQITALCRWYCVGGRPLTIDHMQHGRILLEEAKKATIGCKTPTNPEGLLLPDGSGEKNFDIPCVWVKGEYVGTLQDIRLYEERKQLKDLFQFGFVWKDSPRKLDDSLAGNEGSGAAQLGDTRLPPMLEDRHFFHGRHRGTALLNKGAPVVKLPAFSPRHKEL